MAVNRLSHDAHIGDAGLFDRIHHRGKSAKGNIFISPNEDELVLRVAYLLMQFRGDFIDIDWVIAQKNLLLLIDADDGAALR